MFFLPPDRGRDFMFHYFEPVQEDLTFQGGSNKRGLVGKPQSLKRLRERLYGVGDEFSRGKPPIYDL